MTYGSDEWERAVLAEHGAVMPEGHALRTAAARLARTLDGLAAGAEQESQARAPDYIVRAYRAQAIALRDQRNRVRVKYESAMLRLRAILHLDGDATDDEVIDVVRALAGAGNG